LREVTESTENTMIARATTQYTIELPTTFIYNYFNFIPV
jgi:hypothetical protein